MVCVQFLKIFRVEDFGEVQPRYLSSILITLTSDYSYLSKMSKSKRLVHFAPLINEKVARFDLPILTLCKPWARSPQGQGMLQTHMVKKHY